MGYCRLGLAALAALGLLIAIAAKPKPAGAASVLTLAAMQAEATGSPVLARPVAFHHHARRSQSFYCYPRNYWWFYRPYTTAYDDHARCMPYFHYLEPGRGAKPGRYVK
jgi:hypothetical protein